MIDIALIQLVMLYLVAVVLLVGVSWWRGGRNRRREWRVESRSVVACRACGHVFVDRTLGEFAVCPHCGRPNERNR